MKQTILLALKGVAMGVAEVIPGVSGGTIAFITGIYERLLASIGSVNPALIPIYRSGGVKAVLKAVDARFLLKLFSGMLLGLVFGIKVITHLLENYPLLIWSFFFGLILASIPLVGRQVRRWRWQEIALLVAGSIFVYWVTIAAPSQGSESLIIVFLSGMIAVSALMLPGLSGSFVLLLLGMYTIVMPAVSKFLDHPFGPETWMLLAFGLGMVTGVFSFARLLSRAFKRWKSGTLALLTGFLIGSLNKVWPWQEVLLTRENSHGEMKVVFTQSVWPGVFSNLENNFLYGNDAQLWPCLGMMALAILLIFVLDRYSPSES